MITLFLVTVGLILFFWYKFSLSPIGQGVQKGVAIPEGATVAQIGQILQKEGLIRSPLAFKIYVVKSGLSKKLQAGYFSLSPSASSLEIAQSLTKGAQDVWVTIPEGWRIEEIAQLLEAKLDIPKKEFIAQSKEGYMFPDTYLIPKKSAAQEVAKMMRDNFDRRFSLIAPKLSKTTLTQGEIVILASLVERETKFSEDRPKVAAVLKKRLALGMPLEVDATVQYALGYSQEEKTWWRKNLKPEDLRVNSPYNTRKFAGLPPGPIANPGLSSLAAVGSPLETDYLYYISDKEGKIHFAKTLEEHIQNINRYL